MRYRNAKYRKSFVKMKSNFYNPAYWNFNNRINGLYFYEKKDDLCNNK